MTLLGSLVKTGISLNQKLSFELKTPQERQEEQLLNLLAKAKHTAFGKYYDFNSIIKSGDPVSVYRERVPIHDYNSIHEAWWSRQQKYPDITWPGKPGFFALSSGTTGKESKRIPVSEDFLQSIRDVSTSLIRSLPNFDFPEVLFESEILMLSSSSNLKKSQSGHLEGEISGINVRNFPGWYDLFYRPGKEIAAIDDWDKRIRRIVEEAPEWNIGAIAGIPSWVLVMLQEVIETHRLDTIHDIWPNFQVYASGGVAFDTYRKDFEAISAHPITVIDTYLASEGFFSYTSRPGTLAMELALSHGYFYEFIPFDSRGVDDEGSLLDHPESHTLEQVEQGKEYALVITTCSGAWRYIIGDTIKFTSLDPYEIMLTGRTKFFLNVVGSQLSEEKMDQAIVKSSEKFDITVNEYAVAALKVGENKFVHQWVVVSNNSVEEQAFARQLDLELKDINKNYEVARSKALAAVEVRAIGKEMYHGFLEKKQKMGGQVKTPKVMKASEMRNFLSFIES